MQLANCFLGQIYDIIDMVLTEDGDWQIQMNLTTGDRDIFYKVSSLLLLTYFLTFRLFVIYVLLLLNSSDFTC